MMLLKSLLNIIFAQQARHCDRVRQSSLLLVLLLILTTACNSKEAFSEFHSFPEATWERSERANFEVFIPDSRQRYDIFLEIRNNNDYPFRNLWLFVDITTPDGQQRRDTINAELADVYGKWYGKGVSLYSYSFPYELNIQYPDTGTFTYSVTQGMRRELLKGISDVGLTVLKKTD